MKVSDGGKCLTHRSVYQKERKARETWRDYGTEWQAIRAKVLLEQPRCVECQGLATEVDHIRPLQLGGTHARSNLQSMCKRCHSRKTASETLHKG